MNSLIKYSKQKAKTMMNEWGTHAIPFIFIIDYEMTAIRIFRLDESLPKNLKYCINNLNRQEPVEQKPHYYFKKKSVSFHIYKQAFESIQQQIHQGNTLLVNLTFPTQIDTNLTLNDIYKNSQARYKLLLDEEFVCFSPETFITIKKGVISTFPMKGTIDALLPHAEEILIDSSKETAEHATVVDLLRNDISMVATDVVVKRFRYIDKIITHEGSILQVSSEIAGNLPDNFRNCIGDIIFTMLPAGSVTGAPKHKTVQIINEVEPVKRGYYTGIWGIFDGEDLDSAVMIRFIEIKDGTMQFRSGGGITFMSNANEEYNELIHKVYVPIA